MSAGPLALPAILRRFAGLFVSTGGGTRTLTASRPPDFESGASTIPPLRQAGSEGEFYHAGIVSLYPMLPPFDKGKRVRR